MSMTRLDFNVLAEYLGKDLFAARAKTAGRLDDIPFIEGFTEAVRTVADACKHINGHFDRERFLEAVEDYAQKATKKGVENG